MGRSDEAGAAASAAAPAMAEPVKPQQSSPPEPPGPPTPTASSSSSVARRRARLDGACAAIFRTKLLRQFAALLYKNRESLVESATRERRTAAAAPPPAAPQNPPLPHLPPRCQIDRSIPPPQKKPTVLVAWRSRRSTTVRLAAPFVFLLLALVVRLSLEANSREVARQRSAPRARPAPVRAIPDCASDLYHLARPGRPPCVTFVYSPDDDPVVEVSCAALWGARRPGGLASSFSRGGGGGEGEREQGRNKGRRAAQPRPLAARPPVLFLLTRPRAPTNTPTPKRRTNQTKQTKQTNRASSRASARTTTRPSRPSARAASPRAPPPTPGSRRAATAPRSAACTS